MIPKHVLRGMTAYPSSAYADLARHEAEYADTLNRLHMMTGLPGDVCQAIISVFVERRQQTATPNRLGLSDAVAAINAGLTATDREAIAVKMAAIGTRSLAEARRLVRRL